LRLKVLEALLLLSLPLFGCYLWFSKSTWVPETSRSSQPSMDQAREINAAMPFVEGPIKPARRYIFKGSPAAKLQATDCLATAALYEAGKDERGQKAVIQVILNRLRHPAYPGTVCGVVYQGSSRKTGCQFTFTCDGSYERRRIRTGWATARTIARRMLEGEVFPDVGNATHYHTDWVAPSWNRSFDKLAQVGTHIFYREPRTARSL
jgi:spore germination cell wall hydrolase CwlJ-like protein